MRILHVTPAYVPANRYGGPIRSVHALNRGLAAAGEDVVVFTTNAGVIGPVPSRETIEGVRVRRFFPSFPKSWFRSPALFRALRKEMQEFDIVHITSVFPATTAVAAHIARKLGKPYIISPRGNLMNDPMSRKGFKKGLYFRFIEKKNLEKAFAVHFTSEREMKESIAKFLCSNPIVIMNPMEPPAPLAAVNVRRSLGISESARIILFLGRLHPIKGFDTLLPAFSVTKKEFSDVVLVVAGPDEDGYRREIEKMAEKEGTRESVFFAGEILGAEKAAWFRESSIFAMPSYSENFGMSALEAVSYGVPTVVTEGVGLSEELAKTGSGMVVKKDPRELATAFSKILLDRKFALSLAESGQAFAFSECAPERIAEKFLELYKKAQIR